MRTAVRRSPSATQGGRETLAVLEIHPFSRWPDLRRRWAIFAAYHVSGCRCPGAADTLAWARKRRPWWTDHAREPPYRHAASARSRRRPQPIAIGGAILVALFVFATGLRSSRRAHAAHVRGPWALRHGPRGFRDDDTRTARSPRPMTSSAWSSASRHAGPRSARTRAAEANRLKDEFLATSPRAPDADERGARVGCISGRPTCRPHRDVRSNDRAHAACRRA